MKTVLKKKKKTKPSGKHKVEKKIEEQKYADNEGLNIAEDLDRDVPEFLDEEIINKENEEEQLNEEP